MVNTLYVGYVFNGFIQESVDDILKSVDFHIKSITQGFKVHKSKGLDKDTFFLLVKPGKQD